MDDLWQAVQSIRDELVSIRKVPLLISLVSLSARLPISKEDIVRGLKELEREGKVVLRRGLNDTLIELAKDRERNKPIRYRR